MVVTSFSKQQSRNGYGLCTLFSIMKLYRCGMIGHIRKLLIMVSQSRFAQIGHLYSYRIVTDEYRHSPIVMTTGLIYLSLFLLHYSFDALESNIKKASHFAL